VGLTVGKSASIKRVYNNNVLLATEADDTEVVLLGKGIGLQQAYPGAAEAALDIAELIGESINRVITKDEVSYLALHTTRLYAEMTEHQ
jgi:beta-glucoside operon transcriptional antiterminator